MSRRPRDEQALLAWSKARALQWKGGQTGVPDIGITQAMADAFDLAVSEAESAFLALQSARQLAENRKSEKDDKFAAMEEQLEFLVPSIDAYAKATDDPSVYTRAGIDAPKKPAKRGAPPTPTDMRAELTNGGDVAIRFACTTGGGAFYEIQRRLTALDGMVQTWQPLVTITEKVYTDEAVPKGYRSVDYRVRATRTNGKASEYSESATAYFGSSVGEQPAPAGVTIEDAQKLKDAQTAKGKGQAG
ncbi:MAG: hypothetical protein ACIAS6_02590 [Phycisphaerales bacterium JB060]